MITGRVLSSVWSTRHLDDLPAGAFLEVAIDNSAQRLVAYDTLGCGIGEHVLITQGCAAARWFTDAKRPIDALIIGSIDEGQDVSTASTRQVGNPKPHKSVNQQTNKEIS